MLGPDVYYKHRPTKSINTSVLSNKKRVPITNTGG